ncbi:hypothetical protein PXH69_29070 [Rhodococcus qingshengii]|uniref:Uncharacterized protein n=1 Tax=Rhodococcus qingshengii TaxID=334542 RepID=A0AAW6LS52_RHOSG|nr:hypothetical protein [Rhodococcus qingshengii]MDE8649031.1 hypothetical protein [Rhodococcus qingshengii]
MNDSIGTESDDREAQSIAVIRERLVLAQAIPYELSISSELDESRLRELSPSTVRRLERRTKAGLANPLHGRGNRHFTGFRKWQNTIEESERAWSIWDGWDEANIVQWHHEPKDVARKHLRDMASSPLNLLTPIPFDSDNPREPTPSSAHAFLSRFDARNLAYRSAPLTVAAVTVSVWLALYNYIAGLGVFLCFLALVAAAEVSRHRSLELTANDWYMLEEASVRKSGPMPGTREYGLAHVAVELILLITKSPVWQSETLDGQRTQLNPYVEAAQIIEHAARISELRGKVGERSDGDSDSAIRAQQQFDTNGRILDAVEESLVARVAALYRYAIELRTLDREYVVLAELQKSLELAPDLEELARQTGTDVVAAMNINALTGDIEGVQSAIEAQISVISGDLNALKMYADESE